MKPTPTDLPGPPTGPQPEPADTERAAVAEAFRVQDDLASDHPGLPIQYVIWHTSLDGIEGEITAPGLDAPSRAAVIATFAEHFDAELVSHERPAAGPYAADVRLSFCARRHSIRIFFFTLIRADEIGTETATATEPARHRSAA